MERLDSDLLRTFLAVADTGSMTEGAARIFRTQSAASLQIKRLEAMLGQPVFDRHGRGVTLTPAGESLLPVARDVTAKLDRTLQQINAAPLTGKLRLGLPDDHTHDTLARIIADFTRSHPSVELEVTCDLSARFPRLLEANELDLAVYEVASPPHKEDILWSDPTVWVTSRFHDLVSRDPLPIALFDRDCWWRDAALSGLGALNRPFRIAYSSQSVSGVKAAIEAGVAIGLLGRSSLTDRMHVLGESEGFEPAPDSHLILACAAGEDTPARQSMAQAIRHAFDQRGVS